MKSIRTRSIPLVAWCLAAAVVTPVAAMADESISTDRPDFTETSKAIRPGVFQLESGFTISKFTVDDGLGTEVDIDESGLPELLLRIGLREGVELRIGTPDAQWTEVGGDRAFSRGDWGLGFKFELVPEDFPIGLAAIPSISIASEATDVNRPVTNFVVAWSHDLPRDWSLGGILGHSWVEGVRPNENNTLFPTVALGAPIGESFGAFLEWSAEFAEGSEAAHILHHGYTWGLNPDLQLDIHGAVGLTDAAPDYFIGAGFSVRRGVFD